MIGVVYLAALTPALRAEVTSVGRDVYRLGAVDSPGRRDLVNASKPSLRMHHGQRRIAQLQQPGAIALRQRSNQHRRIEHPQAPRWRDVPRDTDLHAVEEVGCG